MTKKTAGELTESQINLESFFMNYLDSNVDMIVDTLEEGGETVTDRDIYQALRVMGERIEANAQLIAAAPDLLAACEEALNGLYVEHVENCTLKDCSYTDTGKKLSAAIKKAKGE